MSTTTAEICVASPQCVGSSKHLSQLTSKRTRPELLSLNNFKLAHWSPDGSSVVAVDYLSNLKSFLLPDDLFQGNHQQRLTPSTSVPSAEPIYSTAVHPAFSSADLTNTLVLSGIREHPLRLSDIFRKETVATYPLTDPHTEAFIAPHSIQFDHFGQNFIAGSNSSISVFDVSRNGEGPIRVYPTIPSKRKVMVGGGVGIKGIVSTLHTSCERILAAGTFNREIGLYAHDGSGDTVALFSVKSGKVVEGNGIMQVLWSPCGRYLFVAERMSNSILVYDIRVIGRRLTALEGRRAFTNQRMSMDIVKARAGYELWAGGADGFTRMWSSPESRDGEQQSTFQFKSHQDTVCSVGLHPFTSMIATCSGQSFARTDQDNAWRFDVEPNSLQMDSLEFDSSLKLWVFT